MRLYTVVAAAITFLVPVIAAPGSLIPVGKVNGKTSGRHIVRLKPGVDQSSFLDAMNIVTTYNWTIINGFAGEFNEDQINRLRAHRDIEYITEDGFLRGAAVDTQNNATWGLARLSSIGKLDTNINQSALSLDFPFIYETTAGLGVDIYVVDTGINLEHIEFGGRARWGATFGGYASVDEDGHGTHVAGTAAGSSIGVARAANLIAVKVLGDNREGPVSDIISGLDWVKSQASTSGRPSVVSFSVSGGVENSIDNAVTALTESGVHTVVAAGNAGIDAWNVTPAQAPGAIAVGATNITDARTPYSNYGWVIALYAPGELIVSSYAGGPTAFTAMSGTSMAAAHVVGLVAYLISSRGNVSPATMRTNIKNMALNDVLAAIPNGTANQLAQNGLAQNQTLSFL